MPLSVALLRDVGLCQLWRRRGSAVECRTLERESPGAYAARVRIHYTVVPATAGHRWFRGKVALRGRWPLVTGNGHMRHYVKSKHTSDSIYFTAHAQHYEAQRSITMLYRPTVRDETDNAENV